MQLYTICLKDSINNFQHKTTLKLLLHHIKVRFVPLTVTEVNRERQERTMFCSK